MHIDELQLENLIIDSGLVSKDGLTEDDKRQFEAYLLGIPFVSLKNRKIDFATLSLIPEPIARNHAVVAFNKSPLGLEVALLNTSDFSHINFLKKKSGLKILPRLTDTESMKSALLSYQKMLKSEFGDTIQEEAGKLRATNTDPEEALHIVETLIRHAILQDASHVHIEPDGEQVTIRYRINGLLHDAMVLPLRVAHSIVRRIKHLAGLDIATKDLPQDGRFKIDADGDKISFSVSTLPIQHGEKISMRLMRDNAAGFTLEALGFHGEALENIHHVLSRGCGLVVVAGPTGSGKTTTLYTMLDLLNIPETSIGTIEDPVEHLLPRVTQAQVRSDIGFSFAAGLRALIRQAPDVIMVGDLADSETGALAVHTAITDTLVLVSLEASSIAKMFKALLDMKIDPSHLARSLELIIFQQPSSSTKGRMILEVVKVTSHLKELIRTKATPKELESEAKGVGMLQSSHE